MFGDALSMPLYLFISFFRYSVEGQEYLASQAVIEQTSEQYPCT
jgi:hypothetical protein